MSEWSGIHLQPPEETLERASELLKLSLNSPVPSCHPTIAVMPDPVRDPIHLSSWVLYAVPTAFNRYRMAHVLEGQAKGKLIEIDILRMRDQYGRACLEPRVRLLL